MDKERPDPDKILRDIERAEEKKTSGRLKIFFGYAAGVGKTYTMLKSAHSLQKNNIDVVIGYLEPHVFQVERRHKQEQRK